jgi:hypothetical protein
MTADARELASGFLDRRWQPIPVPWAKKRPTLEGWQNLRLNKDDLPGYFRDGRMNVGILLGQPSRGLIDVDLDCPEAIALAPEFLPPTTCRFGRKSKPGSHWEYLAVPLVATTKFQDVDPADQDRTTTMIVEVRSTGSMTVFPGSLHPSGEPIEWVANAEPAVVDGRVLIREVTQLAVAAVLVRHWPAPGARNEMAMAAAGFLARARVEATMAKKIMLAAAREAGDEEFEKRGDVGRTFENLRAGRPVTGGPRLTAFLRGDGTKVVAELRKWLRVSGPQLRDLPAINASDLDLGRVSTAAWDAVLADNAAPVVFRHGGLLVRIAGDDDGTPIVEPLHMDRLRARLARVARWYVGKKR